MSENINAAHTALLSMNALPAIVKSQCHAALHMLREAVESCPDEMWTKQIR